jgi:hypothetical protein
MILLNFAHPLTAGQRDQVESLAGQSIGREVNAPVQIDQDRSLAEQIAAITDRVELTLDEWQTLPLIVNPPGYAPAAAALLAELHGRMGYFPAMLWVQPIPGSTPTRFQVTEVVNLQAIRDAARQARQEETL